MATDRNVKLTGRVRVKQRIRKKVRGTQERPRLSVFRSNKHIYAQVIDDGIGKTMASVSTIDKEVNTSLSGSKSEQAKKIGELLAARCQTHAIKQVVFDRNGYKYHGRIKAVAEAARTAGLQF